MRGLSEPKAGEVGKSYPALPMTGPTHNAHIFKQVWGSKNRANKLSQEFKGPVSPCELALAEYMFFAHLLFHGIFTVAWLVGIITPYS